MKKRVKNDVDRNAKKIRCNAKDKCQQESVELLLQSVSKKYVSRDAQIDEIISSFIRLLDLVASIHNLTNSELDRIVTRVFTNMLYPDEDIGIGALNFSSLLSVNTQYINILPAELLMRLQKRANNLLDEQSDWLCAAQISHLRDISCGIFPNNFVIVLNTEG